MRIKQSFGCTHFGWDFRVRERNYGLLRIAKDSHSQIEAREWLSKRMVQVSWPGNFDVCLSVGLRANLYVRSLQGLVAHPFIRESWGGYAAEILEMLYKRWSKMHFYALSVTSFCPSIRDLCRSGIGGMYCKDREKTIDIFGHEMQTQCRLFGYRITGTRLIFAFLRSDSSIPVSPLVAEISSFDP